MQKCPLSGFPPAPRPATRLSSLLIGRRAADVSVPSGSPLLPHARRPLPLPSAPERLTFTRDVRLNWSERPAVVQYFLLV